MPRWVANQLLAVVVTALCGVLAFAPRGEGLTLHISTGDHFHFDVGTVHHDARHADHAHEHDACDHDDHTVHDDSSHIGVKSAGHDHQCFDLAPLTSDCKSVDRDCTNWLDPAQAVALLPAPVVQSDVVGSPDAVENLVIPKGLAPPDLVGTTILLT